MLHSQSDVRCDPPRRERQSTRFKGCSLREVRLRPRGCRFICQSGSRDTGHGLFGEFDLSSTSTPRPLRDALTPEIGCWRPARRRTAQLSAWTSRRRRRSGGKAYDGVVRFRCTPYPVRARLHGGSVLGKKRWRMGEALSGRAWRLLGQRTRRACGWWELRAGFCLLRSRRGGSAAARRDRGGRRARPLSLSEAAFGARWLIRACVLPVARPAAWAGRVRGRRAA